MSQTQPWDVGGYNTQHAPVGGGGIQLFDPSKFQTTVTTSTGHSDINVTPQAKMFNPAEHQTTTATTTPGYMYGNYDNHMQGNQVLHGSGAENTAVQNQGHGANIDWTNGNQWQQDGGGIQNFTAGYNPGVAPVAQNYFAPRDPQQSQGWNTQQNQWGASQQQQQHQLYPQVLQQQQQPGQQSGYWTQSGDPVWQSLEPQQPWLNQNENGSWGNHSNQADQTLQYPGSDFNPAMPTNINPDGENHASSQGQVIGHPDIGTGITDNSTYSNTGMPPYSANVSPNTGQQFSQNAEQFNPGSVVAKEEDNLNDSGTVSSFFGRGDSYDESESTMLSSHGSGSLGLSTEGAVNPVLLSVPSLHRNYSEISNSSLQTYHNSLDSLDGENMRAVQEITDKFNSASLQDSTSNTYAPYGGPVGESVGHTEPEAFTAGQHPIMHGVDPLSGQPYQGFSDTHSLSSHHSGDLTNSLNQEAMTPITPMTPGQSPGRRAQHSHHSSLDSVELLLASGSSSLSGTPGKLPNPGQQGYTPSPPVHQQNTNQSEGSPGRTFGHQNLSSQELSTRVGHPSFTSTSQTSTNLSPQGSFSNIPDHSIRGQEYPGTDKNMGTSNFSSPRSSLSDISRDVSSSTANSQAATNLMNSPSRKLADGHDSNPRLSHQTSNNPLSQGLHEHVTRLPDFGSPSVHLGAHPDMSVSSPEVQPNHGALNTSSDSLQHLNITGASDMSTGSSLNISTDSVLARPSSAFKPPAKTGASRQNSSSSNPGDQAGSVRTPPVATPPSTTTTQNVNPLSNYFGEGQSRSSSSSPGPGSNAGAMNSQKPPRPPSRGRERSQYYHRHLQQKHRGDNNISPATTLWEPPESSIIHAPVILAPAPASPLTSPTHKAKSSPNAIIASAQVAQRISDTSVHQPVIKRSEKDPANTDRSDSEKRAESGTSRDAHTQDAVGSSERAERPIGDTPRRGDNLAKSQPADEYPRRGKPRRQSSRERVTERGVKSDREAQNSTSNDRPPSRTDSLKDEYLQGYHYRDPYGTGYRSRRGYDEEYDRPRSRQEEDNRTTGTGQEVTRPRSRADERPRSRTDYEPPRSRAEYDAYYDREYRSRYGDYDYDTYYRRGGAGYYYDRDGYYDYHHNRYATGYYDEYYRYNQDQYGAAYYQDSQVGYDDSDRHSQTSAHSQSRGNTPAKELDDVPASHQGYSSNRPHSRSQYGYGYDDLQQAFQHDRSYDNIAFSSRYGYDYSGYGEYAQKPMEPGKFSLPHVGIQLASGGHLITIQPNRPDDGQPAIVELHDIHALLEDDVEAVEMKSFSGPLIKGETHKNDVVMFCQLRARECRENVEMVDRDSAELLWRFLELIIKQNGTVVGTDISDLLLEGHEPTTLEYKSSGVKISTSRSQSMENLLDVAGGDEGEESEKSVAVTSDRSLVNSRKTMPVEEVTDRFRHLLLYGRKKDSLDWAMKHNLWGHALFLASKMDTRTHANVMIRFANSSMRMNDPLQTLYQFMSGRQPAAVTCISDEKWGDWRPHLAMILSNHTSKPDLDRRSIVTLGDTLASRGYLHASHFCYLMAQVEFGTYAKKTSKLVLVGSSHNLPLEEFASNLAIQCTEVYEYAVTLGNPLSTMAAFQPYKYMYACRLAEYGFTQEALHYCEVVATTVNQAPGLYQVVFVKQLFELSSRLKFYDPQRQEVGYELDDPYWLQQLQRACLGLEDGSIQPISGTATPGMTTGSSESGEIVGLTSAAEMTYNAYQTGQEGEYQQQAYSAEQWSQQQYGQDQVQGQEQGQDQGQDVSQYGQGQGQQYGVDGQGQQQQQQDNAGYGGTMYDPSQYNQGYNYGYQQADQSTATDGTTYNYGAQAGYNQMSQDYNAAQSVGQSDAGNLGPRQSFSSTTTTEEEESEARNDVLDGPQTTGMMLDYWGASTSHKVYGGPSVSSTMRQRTTSGSSTQSNGRSRTLSGSSTHSVKASPYMNKAPQNIKPMDRSSQNQKKPASSGGGNGFFGYIKSKITAPFATPKNEMKLPKDEKPSIIWDSVKNRWVNTDGGEEEEEKPAAPPPKDSELNGGHSIGSGPSIGAGGPSLSNRFQIPKTKGPRNRYVDVFNPGSTTSTPSTASAVPDSLFNVLPSTNSTPQAIFTPGSVPGNHSNQPIEGNPAPNVSSTLTAPTAVPELTTGTQHSRSSSLSSLSREVQQFTRQAIQQAEREAAEASAKDAGMPLMFDPTQFTAQNAQVQPQGSGPGPSGTVSSMASGGPRYGQRRQYPKKH